MTEVDADTAIAEALDRLRDAGKVFDTTVLDLDSVMPEHNYGPRCFDRSGRPISFGLYCVLFEDHGYRQVAHDEVAEGIRVSTIWLGFDHGFGARQMLFETLVAVELDEPLRFEMFDREFFEGFPEGYRWGTEEEALAGHARVVAELRAQMLS